jgi:hypothetical protein
MSTDIISTGIRKVTGGYIVNVRWPYGRDPAGYGEVICQTWEEVVALLTRAANFGESGDPKGRWIDLHGTEYADYIYGKDGK